MRKKTFIDIDAFVKECVEELKAIGIRPSDNLYVYTVSMKGIPALGSCQKFENEYVLKFEKNAFTDKSNTKILKALVCHELLHATKGCEGHTKKFLKLSKKVQDAYGYEMFLAPTFRDVYTDENEVIGYYICPVCGRYSRIYKTDDHENKIGICVDHGVQTKKVLIQELNNA